MVKFMGDKALVSLLLACVAVGLTAVALHTSARGKTELLSFGGVFSAWVHNVDTQVKAAVSLSRGLSTAKDAQLAKVLQKDLAQDVMKSGSIVAELGGSKAALAKYAASTAAKASAAAAFKASMAPAAPKAAVAKAPKMAVAVVAKAAVAKPVQAEKKGGISPFSKPLTAAISRDDAEVAVEERQVALAEKKLVAAQGLHETPVVDAPTPVAVVAAMAAEGAAAPVVPAARRVAAAGAAKAAATARAKQARMVQAARQKALAAEVMKHTKLDARARAEERKEVASEEGEMQTDLANWGFQGKGTENARKAVWSARDTARKMHSKFDGLKIATDEGKRFDERRSAYQMSDMYSGGVDRAKRVAGRVFIAPKEIAHQDAAADRAFEQVSLPPALPLSLPHSLTQ
ncbi:hypothetical protein T484DRAFT_2711270 [Baffinella frigidus]|nr:hypothetical protein T484DRAFT_2711270 [Cryptophyta sp. CCMP2293]